MDEKTKQIAIISVAALFGLGVWLYFSPYQQCVRELTAAQRAEPAAGCAARLGGRR